MNGLKKLRQLNNYTLDDIEAKTGIKRGTYDNYENGKTEPKLATWQKLADFFEVSVSYLQGIELNSNTSILEQYKKQVEEYNIPDEQKAEFVDDMVRYLEFRRRKLREMEKK